MALLRNTAVLSFFSTDLSMDETGVKSVSSSTELLAADTQPNGMHYLVA